MKRAIQYNGKLTIDITLDLFSLEHGGVQFLADIPQIKGCHTWHTYLHGLMNYIEDVLSLCLTDDTYADDDYKCED